MLTHLQKSHMNFAKLFHKSNSSINQLQGNVLDCSIEQIRGNKVIVDTGMRASFVCFRDELSLRASASVGIVGYKFSRIGPSGSNNQNGRILLSDLKNLPSRYEASPTLREVDSPPFGEVSLRRRRRDQHARQDAETSDFGRPCVIGVEEKRSSLSGELICSAPKTMEKISKRKLVWTELTKLWRTSVKNRMKARLRLDGSIPGFILNSVNGGYAVAIAGYIAFLPKSLCLNKKVFIGQWRQFAIIGMNPKIANIVVKEIRMGLSALVFSKAKALSKRRRRIRAS